MSVLSANSATVKATVKATAKLLLEQEYRRFENQRKLAAEAAREVQRALSKNPFTAPFSEELEEAIVALGHERCLELEIPGIVEDIELDDVTYAFVQDSTLSGEENVRNFIMQRGYELLKEIANSKATNKHEFTIKFAEVTSSKEHWFITDRLDSDFFEIINSDDSGEDSGAESASKKRRIK